MKKNILKKSELVRVRAPRGYSFNIVEHPGEWSYTYIRLYKNGVQNWIGQISLEPQGNKKFATHSSLDTSYHGKKLGATMYAKAIQWCLDKGYKVGSSHSPSDYAQRVWGGSSLRRFFSIRKNFKEGSYYKTWSVLKQKKRAVPKPVKKKRK